MNEATRLLKGKGYNLTTGLKAVKISLRTFRRYEKSDEMRPLLIGWINKLDSNIGGVGKS